jgi:hypothetical protein
MGGALRSLLLLAGLSLWLGSAGAFCVSEIAYEYVMRGEEPTPERTLPCCAAASRVALPTQEDGPLDGRCASVANAAVPAFNEARPFVLGAVASPLRWRAYCERSSRLLR